MPDTVYPEASGRARTDEPDSAARSAALRRDLEALLFAAGRPLSLTELAAASGRAGAEELVSVVLGQIERDFPVDGPRGIELARVAGGWQFRTNRLSETALSALFDADEDLRLSPAALEVLAIVAYLQPVSRPQIAEIRGVNSDSAVQTLVDRELIAEVGRRDGPGGAVLYATTIRFQVVFGLPDLEALPPIASFAPTIEDRDELRRRLGLIVSPD